MTEPVAPQADIQLINEQTVLVTTELRNKTLVLKINGDTFNTVSDQFCRNKGAPAQMRLNVAYLTNGDTITGTWTGNGESGAFEDDPSGQVIYADFDVPAAGASPVSYNFTIVDVSGNVAHDPVIIVFQVETC